MFSFESSSPFSSVSSSFPHSLALNAERALGQHPDNEFLSLPLSWIVTRDDILVGDTFNLGEEIGSRLATKLGALSNGALMSTCALLWLPLSISILCSELILTRFFSDSSECSALCHQQGTTKDRVTKVANGFPSRVLPLAHLHVSQFQPM